MISTKEIKILEDNSEYFGVSKLQLMENAGKAVADYIKDNYYNKKILVVCAHGNNGGDGFVCARHLNAKVLFISKEENLKNEAKINFKKLKKHQLSKNKSLINSYDVVVDAIFGYGIKGEVKGTYKRIIEKINKSKKPIISIDVPSGLDPDTGQGYCVKPKIVLTFHDTKPGLKKFKYKAIDIGIRMQNFIGPGELRTVLKKREKNTHKGDYGKVLIIAGSKDYAGAPLLAAKAVAALRTGADIVTIAAPEKVAWAINSQCPDLITTKFKCDYFSKKEVKDALKLSQDFDIILIGPGLSLKAKDFVKEFVKKTKKPLVIDADALKFIKLKDIDNAILTPHSKELEILLKHSKISKKNLQKNLKNNVLLIKGNVDEIISKNKVKYNKTGNPSMTVGGTGDVLAGLCAGFYAQSKDAFNSACAAAFINGFVGDNIAKVLGSGLIASDLLREIAYTVNKFVEIEKKN